MKTSSYELENRASMDFVKKNRKKKRSALLVKKCIKEILSIVNGRRTKPCYGSRIYLHKENPPKGLFFFRTKMGKTGVTKSCVVLLLAKNVKEELAIQAHGIPPDIFIVMWWVSILFSGAPRGVSSHHQPPLPPHLTTKVSRCYIARGRRNTATTTKT